MVKSNYIPDALTQYYGKELMCRKLEETLGKLREKPESFAEEIIYMEESIHQLDKELRESRDEIFALLDPIKFDYSAWMCACFHYICGMTYEELSNAMQIGPVNTPQAAQLRVIRALRKVYGDKELTAKDKRAIQIIEKYSVEN